VEELQLEIDNLNEEIRVLHELIEKDNNQEGNLIDKFFDLFSQTRTNK